MQDGAPVDLPSRIVLALLRGAVRASARFGLPLGQTQQLVRLAYYEVVRAEHPRDRKAVADRLGVSLRTAAELAHQLKALTSEPEDALRHARAVREAIDAQPRSTAALRGALDLDGPALDAALQTLVANGWIEDRAGVWVIRGAVQSFLGGSLPQKLDGLERQQQVIADAAHAAFFDTPDGAATARTWVFHADPAEFAAFREQSLRDLRGRMVELDEAAPGSSAAEQVGVTVVFSRMKP